MVSDSHRQWKKSLFVTMWRITTKMSAFLRPYTAGTCHGTAALQTHTPTPGLMAARQTTVNHLPGTRYTRTGMRDRN